MKRPVHTAGRQATPTVFVVDDDASVREALNSLIRSVGLRVEMFATAKEFLRRANPGRPRLSGVGRALAGPERT